MFGDKQGSPLEGRADKCRSDQDREHVMLTNIYGCTIVQPAQKWGDNITPPLLCLYF